MKERGTTKPPYGNAKDLEEKRLGSALTSIRQNLIKTYIELKTEEEIEQYRANHPELEEVLEIVKWIDENNLSPYLVNAREIKKWMEERGTTKPPSNSAKDATEHSLGRALSRIRQNEKHPELEEVQEIVKWIDENNLSPYLVNARDIKKWMEERGTTKPPSPTAKEAEEKKLGTALSTIRRQLIKPYLKLKTEEEKEKYRKEHPEIEEVQEIVKWIDENNLSLYLVNARGVKKWMERRKKIRNSIKHNKKKLNKAIFKIKNRRRKREI